jgi:hypothetical protein
LPEDQVVDDRPGTPPGGDDERANMKGVNNGVANHSEFPLYTNSIILMAGGFITQKFTNGRHLSSATEITCMPTVVVKASFIREEYQKERHLPQTKRLCNF